MSDSIKLQGDGNSQKLGNCSFTAPGIEGTLTVWTGSKQEAVRGENEPSPFYPEILAHLGISEEKIFELDITSDRGTPTGEEPTEGTRSGGDGMELLVPALSADPEEDGCVLLMVDESGEHRWLFPEERPTNKESLRGGAPGNSFVFDIPRIPETKATEGDENKEDRGNESVHRGIITKIGRRILRVFMWGTDKLVGPAARKLISMWEDSRRPYLFLTCDPNGEERFRPLPRLEEQADDAVLHQWQRLDGKRSLLLLHGTFSTAQAAFDGISREQWNLWSEQYEGRIFAFNHRTLTATPQENAQELLNRLPPNFHLSADVVMHSRGGLVGRELMERLSLLELGGRQVSIGKAVFVGVPHLGTKLVQEGYMVDFVDRYTNLLTRLPDGPFAYALEGVLAAVKVIYHGAVKALDGLQSMNPAGSYLEEMNRDPSSSTIYHAIGADFAPQPAGILSGILWGAVDGAVDRVFQAGNDVVVPSDGCFGTGGANSHLFEIPQESRLFFPPKKGVNHLNYFLQEETLDAITKWCAQN